MKSPFWDSGYHDTHTGWKTISRMVVEEFREADSTIAGASR